MTMTKKLIERFGEDKLYQIWSENNGMYKAAENITQQTGEYCSPYVVRYLSNKFNWVRSVTDKSLAIYKAVLLGKVEQGFYKHITFE